MIRIVLVLCLITSVWAKLNVKDLYHKSYNYEKMRDYDDAIKVLKPLYRKYPRGYTLNLRLAWLFYLSGRYANAIDHYKRASLVLPSSLEPKLGLAMVYLAMRNYKAAKETATSIVRTDYYNYYGNIYLVRSLLALKEYKSAAKVAEKMLSIYPTDVKFLTFLARAYKSIDPARSKRIYMDVLILDPNNPEAKEALE